MDRRSKVVHGPISIQGPNSHDVFIAASDDSLRIRLDVKFARRYTFIATVVPNFRQLETKKAAEIDTLGFPAGGI